MPPLAHIKKSELFQFTTGWTSQRAHYSSTPGIPQSKILLRSHLPFLPLALTGEMHNTRLGAVEV